METVRENNPQLRFSGSLIDWKILKYGDIFSFYTTNSFSRDMLNYEVGEVKNVHYGDIHTKFSTLFDICKENVPYVNNGIDISKIKDVNYCKVGDLVIADASEDHNDIGKTIEIINLDNKKVVAGLHTFLARPKQNSVALGFTGYLLQSWNVRKQVMTIAQGSKVLSLSYNRLGQINLSIPSLSEQQKIASFFTSVDAKISQLTRKKELLEQYKKGVMQRIFKQEIRFKDDIGNEYPKWEKKTIKELNIFISDGNYGELYPKSSEMKSSGIPFIRANNIKNLKLVWDDMRFIEEEHHKVLLSGHLKTNDILVTTRGEIGMLAYVNEEFNNSNINAQICLLRSNDNIVSKYLLYVLDYSECKKQFKELQTGSALKQLPRKSLEKILINYPSINEQTKIANFLSVIDDKINYVAIQLNKTKEFKKGLLQQMFV